MKENLYALYLGAVLVVAVELVGLIIGLSLGGCS